MEETDKNKMTENTMFILRYIFFGMAMVPYIIGIIKIVRAFKFDDVHKKRMGMILVSVSLIMLITTALLTSTGRFAENIK